MSARSFHANKQPAEQLPQGLSRFRPVINTFGELPSRAQRQLADALQFAVMDAVAANKLSLSPGEHAGRLGGIADAVDNLLRGLDAEDGHLPTWTGPLALDLGKRHISLPSLITDLRELAVVSEEIARTERGHKKPGKGGARRQGQGPRGVLLWNLFDIYADTRSRFPESGPAIGYGGPLLRFVRAVHTVLKVQAPTDRAVKAAFDRWCRAQNKHPPALK
jgi:hypothetical protein